MKKKIALGLLLMLVIVGMVSAIYIFTEKSVTQAPVVTQPKEPEEPVQSVQPEQPVVEEPIEEPSDEQDRTVVLDDIKVAERADGGVVDSVEGLSKLWSKPTFQVPTDFSNGFVATTTEHVDCMNVEGKHAVLRASDSDALFEVFEKDALFNSIESLREDYLTNYYPDYFAHIPSEIKREDTVLNEGLKDFQDYFELDLVNDVTNTEYQQILADTTISTALGDGLLIETYNKSINTFYMNVFIKCECERIIVITCSSADETNLLAYITEITNSGIYLIK